MGERTSKWLLLGCVWSMIATYPCLAQVNVAQLDQLAGSLVTAGNLPFSGQIVVDPVHSSGFAAITFTGRWAYIYVHPDVIQTKPLNTWAFVLGHELGHQALGHRGDHGPSGEADADVFGANLAIKVGYDIRAFINALYRDPNSCTMSHGCWHSRARNLELKFLGTQSGWSEEHRGHEPGRGAFPPPSNQRIQRQVACQHRIPCQHAGPCTHTMPCQHIYPCQHPIWNGFAWVQQHSYDQAHPYDQPHTHDQLHEFDLLHAFDIVDR